MSYRSSFVEFLRISVSRDFQQQTVILMVLLDLSVSDSTNEAPGGQNVSFQHAALSPAHVPSQGKGFPTDRPGIKK